MNQNVKQKISRILNVNWVLPLLLPVLRGILFGRFGYIAFVLFLQLCEPGRSLHFCSFCSCNWLLIIAE